MEVGLMKVGLNGSGINEKNHIVSGSWIA